MKKIYGLVAALATTLAIVTPSAHAALISTGNGSVTDTATGWRWRTFAQYDGLDYASAVALLPSSYQVATAEQLATLTAAAPADPATFADDLAALGANASNGILWGFYGDGSTFLFRFDWDTTWNSNAANPYGWANWNYGIPADFKAEGLSLFAVDTSPANAVPEPGTLGVFAAGAAMLALSRRRKSADTQST